jgi:hypothetical protein
MSLFIDLPPRANATFKANECASFVLRTNDAVSNDTLTTHTWRNINLRTLMGNDMYDKYDLFMLKPILIANATNPPSNWGNVPDDRNCVLNIQGLPFINHLNSTTLTKLSSCPFSSLITRIGYTTSTNGGTILTFGKYQELVDLTIFYSRINKNGSGNYRTQTTTGFPFPHFVFSFNIYGINTEIEKE